MRFIHTSDWHLGRLFHGRHLTDDQAYVLEQFCALVGETRPDAVVIAGDIYDRAVPPTEAVELLDDTLSRLLLEIKVPVLMIAGNHDSPERIGFAGRLLARQGLCVAGRVETRARPVALSDEFGEVYFLPIPYAEPAPVRNAFARPEIADHGAAMELLVGAYIKQIPASARKVAIAHAFVAGGAESESERPLSAGGSANVASKVFEPFHYTALGHLHNAQRAGAERIRYAGSLLKYSFDEAHQKKGVYLVEMDRAGEVRVETFSLRPKRDVRKVEGYFAELLSDRLKFPPTDDYVMATLKDNCAILDAHGRLSQVYPNLMQIDRPHLLRGGALQKTREDFRTKTETQLFADFYAAATGETLSPEQKAAFDGSLDELLAMRREAGV